MRHDECPMAIALHENRPVRGYEAIAERPDGSRIVVRALPDPVAGRRWRADRSGQRPDRRHRSPQGRGRAHRECRGAARLERGQGRVPRPRVARAADAGHDDLRQRPGAPRQGGHPRRGRSAVDGLRHRRGFGAAARDHREPVAADPPRLRDEARRRAAGPQPRRPQVDRRVHPPPRGTAGHVPGRRASC